jgi:alpha-tubulin suppressor-like RCC1 family protein
VKAVAAGGGIYSHESHTCVLTNTGSVYCWGSNSFGQLGDGTTTDSRTPVVVQGLSSGVRAITAGTKHTCAITSTGDAYCWGANDSGQLGDGTAETRLIPVAVAGLNSGVSAIAAGGGNQATGSFTCALTDAGAVYCWGDTNHRAWNGSRTPLVVEGLSSGAKALAAGNDHACAVMSTGNVRCWGNNNAGQLGSGFPNTRLDMTPVEVVGLSGAASAVSAAGREYYFYDYTSYTCALMSAGAVYCWGKFFDATPVVVEGLDSGVNVLSAAGWNTCALTSGGGVYCFSGPSETPVGVAGLSSGVSAIDVGTDHTCAVTDAGGVHCWGNNSVGQLGDGNLGRMPFPVAVIGFGEAYTISGQVTDSNNNPIADAIVSDGIRITTTDSNGNYTLSNVPAGSYTLTPEKIGYTFTPTTHSVTVSDDVSGQDFTATATASPVTLESNVTTGAPGSVFVLAAHNFPPNSQAVISLKAPGMPTFKEMLRQTMDAEGHLVFLFLTGADNPPGAYTIRLTVQTAATGLAEEMVQETTITLADDAPQRTDRPADDVPTVDVNALSGSIYLPLVIR